MPGGLATAVLDGQSVDLAVLYQLEPVFDSPEEPVGVREAICVRSGDVPACSQSLERSQRRRGPQRGVVATVHQLEQLHRELDVADAAAAQLYLPLGKALAVPPLCSARAFMARSARRSSAPRGRPHTRVAACSAKASPELGAAGGRPGLEEGLELPGLCPAVPVGEVGGEAAHERAGAAFGAELQVGPPGLADQVDQRLGVATADQHHVDVAAVVELAGARACPSR